MIKLTLFFFYDRSLAIIKSIWILPFENTGKFKIPIAPELELGYSVLVQLFDSPVHTILKSNSIKW